MDSRIYALEANKCSESSNKYGSKIKKFHSNIKKTKKSLTTQQKDLEESVTPLSKVHDSEVDYNWRWNDRTDPKDPNRHIIGTNTYNTLKLEKESEKRNKKLAKKSFGSYAWYPYTNCYRLHDEYTEELPSLYSTNPVRAGVGAFDHGEIDELDKQCDKNAVRRYGSVLLRVSTGKPVAWSKTENKWIDIEVSDKQELKKLKQLIQRDEEKELY